MSSADKLLHLGRGAGLFCLAAIVGAGCASTPSVRHEAAADTELDQACSAAMSAYERGEFEQATFLYRRALARSRAMDTPHAIADAAYNLAACEAALEHYDQADHLLQEAEYETSRSKGDAAEILLLRAKVAYLHGRAAEARSLADGLVSKAPGAGNAHSGVRLPAMILIAQIACDEKNAAAANAQLVAVTSEAAREAQPPSAAVRADWMKAVGALRLLEGKPAESAAAFEQEAQLSVVAHRYRDVWKSLASAARAWSDAKQSGLAADRYYRAARSAAALGEASAAKELTASSTAAAAASSDQVLLHLSMGLMQELTGGAGGP